MVDLLNRKPQPDGAIADAAPCARGAADGTRLPLCFVVDDEPTIRHFLSLILHGAGIDTEEFGDTVSFREAVKQRRADLIFLNVGLESSEAIHTLHALGERGFFGYVQLMSSRGAAMLKHVKGVGLQQKLQTLPVLKKPFETSAILGIVQYLKLGHAAPIAGRVGLDEALRKNWIEFWYQPKIDLRKKQLAGAETFARVRHPEFGVLPPRAFMPGANETAIIALAEVALTSALKAGVNFSKLGISLRFAVNIPMNALIKLPVAEIVRAHRPDTDFWPGLIIDVNEEQIVTELALADDMAKSLAHLNVRLAIDDFGRGHASLIRLKELPFAEIKIDRTFVTDCSTDKVNAPICKTVIDLAHNFGSLAVGIGVEKASDALALTSMGCDLGQGYLLGRPMPFDRFTSLLRQRAGAAQKKPRAEEAAAAR